MDKKRTAILGWGYGGFVAALSLTSQEKLFSCGMLIAPIINMRLYDSYYTERYMGTPTLAEDYVTYNRADVSRRAANFKGKRLLIIHGTADQNVHSQHSMLLMRALAKNNITYRSQVRVWEFKPTYKFGIHLVS